MKKSGIYSVWVLIVSTWFLILTTEFPKWWWIAPAIVWVVLALLSWGLLCEYYDDEKTEEGTE